MTEFIIQHEIFEDIPFITCTSKNIKPKKAIFLFHRLLQSKEYELPIAYKLAGEGYYVILLDFKGHGERVSSFSTSKKYNFNFLFNDVAGMIDDIKDVIAFLRSKENVNLNWDSVGMAGVSVGGMVALLATYQMKEAEFAVSIISGANWWPLVESGSFNSFQFFSTDRPVMSPKLVHSDVERYDPYFNIDKYNGKPVLMVNGNLDMAIPLKIVEPFYERLKRDYTEKKYGERVCMHKYARCGHEVTPWMIQDIIIWLREWG